MHSPIPSVRRTTPLSCPARAQQVRSPRSEMAAKVSCCGWILMKAFPCDDGTGTSPTPVASSLLGGLHHAFLPATRRHPILCRRRSARQGQLRRHPRPRRSDTLRGLPTNPDAFLTAVAPFRDGLLVACECMHCWYWLADTCRDHGKVPFVLRSRHWAMKAVHGCKTKCDRKDAEAIARLLKGGCATSRRPMPIPKRTQGPPRSAPRTPAPRPPTRRAVRPRPHCPPSGQPAPPSSPAMSSTRVNGATLLPPTSPIPLCPPTCRDAHRPCSNRSTPPSTPPGEGDRCRRRRPALPRRGLAASAIDSRRRQGAVANHPVGDRHHRPLRHPSAVLFLCPAVRCRAVLRQQSRCGVGNRQGRQRLAEVGSSPRPPCSAAQKDERIGGLLNRLARRGLRQGQGLLGPGPQTGPGLSITCYTPGRSLTSSVLSRH